MSPSKPRDENDGIHIGNYTPGDIALFKDIAETAAEHAVNRLFIAMGLDPKEPLESQRDFHTLRKLAQRETSEDEKADATWVRRMRLRSEGVFGKVILGAAGLTLAGAAHTFWIGFKALVK